MPNASWHWVDVKHGRLPMTRDRLIGNYRTALTNILIITFFYQLIRGSITLLPFNKDLYAQEFARIPGGHWTIGSYRLASASVVLYSLFSKKFFIWRFGCLMVAASLWFWAYLFLSGRGTHVLDAIVSYAAFAAMYTIIAVFSSDPRPLRKLRGALEDLAVNGMEEEWTGKPLKD